MAIDNVMHQFMDQVNKHHPSIKTAEFQKLLSTQRVTQRGKRKAPLKGKSYESSGLIFQNKYLFRAKLAERRKKKQREKFLLKTFSPMLN